MPRLKVAAGTTKKLAAKRTVKRVALKVAAPQPAARKSAAPKSGGPKVPRKRPAPKVLAPVADHGVTMAEPVISEEQVLVVASKFVSGEAPPAKSPPRPTLPLSYGESHLLLLPRDPQTLFAAWDVSASTIASLKERIGGRALAVSTFTLRLVRENGAATVFHLAKKHRSRYLKIDGPSPSFVAEVGFTTPAGRFELIARSAACSVPGGSTPRPDPAAFGRRTVIGYREARSLVRRGLAAPASGARGRVRAQALLTTAAAAAAVAAPRVLGGASDLYRR